MKITFGAEKGQQRPIVDVYLDRLPLAFVNAAIEATNTKFNTKEGNASVDRFTGEQLTFFVQKLYRNHQWKQLERGAIPKRFD